MAKQKESKKGKKKGALALIPINQRPPAESSCPREKLHVLILIAHQLARNRIKYEKWRSLLYI
jgi:hypothetical protein